MNITVKKFERTEKIAAWVVLGLNTFNVVRAIQAQRKLNAHLEAEEQRAKERADDARRLHDNLFGTRS